MHLCTLGVLICLAGPGEGAHPQYSAIIAVWRPKGTAPLDFNASAAAKASAFVKTTADKLVDGKTPRRQEDLARASRSGFEFLPQGNAKNAQKRAFFFVLLVFFCGWFIFGFSRPLFPLQNVKEQARERRIRPILPRFSGTAR
jgi:hypothetical protein